MDTTTKTSPSDTDAVPLAEPPAYLLDYAAEVDRWHQESLASRSVAEA